MPQKCFSSVIQTDAPYFSVIENTLAAKKSGKFEWRNASFLFRKFPNEILNTDISILQISEVNIYTKL